MGVNFAELIDKHIVSDKTAHRKHKPQTAFQVDPEEAREMIKYTLNPEHSTLALNPKN